MKLGDKIRCSNGHTYTLSKSNTKYTFALIDEFGEEVNQVMDYYLHDCLISSHEDYCELCVGVDIYDHSKNTQVLELIES